MRFPADNPARSIAASPRHLAAAVATALLAILSLFVHQRYLLPAAAVVFADGYLLAMLWIAARVGQGRAAWRERLPLRTTALVALAALAVALIAAFAGLYLETQGVVSATGVLHKRIDAIYFSTVTMTTLGYGDFVPRSDAARLIVMAELASAVLLLVGALPLLVSRLGSLVRDDEPSRNVSFGRLKISLPGQAEDEIAVDANTFTWRRFTFALAVTRSANGEFTYRCNGGEAVAVDAARTLVIDQSGTITQA